MSDADLTFVLGHSYECTDVAITEGEIQPCKKLAVAAAIAHSGGAHPVCARHARADMVPLPDLIAAVQEKIAAEIEESADPLAPSPYKAGLLSASRIVRSWRAP